MIFLFHGNEILVMFGLLLLLLIVGAFGVAYFADWLYNRKSTENVDRPDAEDTSVD
jgi:hypothetical protein